MIFQKYSQRQVGSWFFHSGLLKLPFLLFIGLATTVYFSCSKKKAHFQPTDALGIANKWVYDSMKLYYYWSGDITANPDYTLPTPDFFRSLLSSKDRFSAITNRTAVPHRTTAELYGFQYAFITHPFNTQQLVGVVTVVVPNSDAATRVKLVRGQFFTKVNGVAINAQNKELVLAELESATNSNVMLQLAALDDAGASLNDSSTVAIQRNVVTQKSVYAARVFENNGVKTGYLAYYFCLEREDGVLLQKLQALKDAGIKELILDLRYNPGGSVASATKLAAALVPTFDPAGIFITYKGNKHGGTQKLSFKEAIAFSTTAAGKDMNYLQGLNNGLQRIFIITSGGTASAAELLTNNLAAYMPVKKIGQTTLGKDEASFTIEDSHNPRTIDWVLNPIIYKVSDAQGRGGYNNGIAPDYVVNEFARLPLPELAMPGDLPVEKALELIYGNSLVMSGPVRRRGFHFPAVRAVYYPDHGL